MTKRAADTIAASVYDELRSEILSGRLRPGERLKPAEIGERLQASGTVVREALTRLAAQHLVRSRQNQGFTVVPLVRRDLENLTTVRMHVEPHALRLAVERSDLQWESKALAAHHLLANSYPASHPVDKTTDEFANLHAKFHETLIAGCNNPLLTDMCHMLWNMSDLYRRWSVTSGKAVNRASEHQQILDACLARKPELAEELLRKHIQGTTEILLARGWGDEAATEALT